MPKYTEEDYEQRWQQDPIARCEAWLRDSGTSEEQLTTFKTQAEQEMQQAFDSAKSAPWPENALTFSDVQDIGDPSVRAY